MFLRHLRWLAALILSIVGAGGPLLAAGEAQSKAGLTEFALKKEGDADRGRALFENLDRLACVRCHSVDGSASKPGPDLAAAGDKFGRRELIEAVLYPSRTIAVGYSTLLVATKDGELHVGILKDRPNGAVDLMEADGKRHHYADSVIASERFSDVSLMPENLEAPLSLQEFADLVEYLVSLKQRAGSALLEHGMPREIHSLQKPIGLVPLYSESLRLGHLSWAALMPGSTNRFLVIEHELGKLWVVDTIQNNKSLFADFGTHLSDKGARGLVGAVLHPSFPRNRLYYIIISKALEDGTHTLLVERKAALDGLSDSGEPAREILRIKASSNNHYGGGLVFGPDGFLYAGIGDTGPQEDPRGNGQNMMNLAGKMLRIDVNRRDPSLAYAIPRDNPFVKTAGVRPEIWASGLREPWRFSFDPVTHELWAGDVGQDRYEEVDLIEKGKNYGWNVFEGFERFSNQYRRTNAEYAAPVFSYSRKYGPSVTGGFVCRVGRPSTFNGVYIFGDYESKRIWGLKARQGKLQTIRQIGASPQRIVSFASGPDGTLYLVGYEGMIYRCDFTTSRFE